MNQLRDLIFSDRAIIGPFMKACDPAFVEVAGLSGFHFVILDMEHGPASLKEIENNIRAASAGKTCSVVRVKNAENISSVLDLGADGFMLPNVKSVNQAQKAIETARFHPTGMRGVCRYVRAADYSSTPKEQYFNKANDAVSIIQIEGQEAISELDAILNIEGLDMIFIGPYDLSQSLGVPGQVEHPVVLEKMKEVVEKAGKENMKVGTFVDDVKTGRLWISAGVHLIAYSVDMGIFHEACKSVVNEFKHS